MNFIKELTEPKIFSDGVIRTPNALMLRAARVIKQIQEAYKGLERSLHTTQLQVQTDIRNLDKQILSLRARNKELEESIQKPDMTEFYEINNKDRE